MKTLIWLAVLSLAFGLSAKAGVDPQKFLYTFEIDREAGERYQPLDTLESEREQYQRLISLFATHFKSRYSAGHNHSDQGEHGQALRAVHAKGHGCLIGKLRIEDHQKDIYRHSIFKAPATFSIVARFSNGDGPPEKDGNRTISIGMAFKVLDVRDPKLLPEQRENSIDFLMTNHAGFVARNISDFAELIEGREYGLLEKLGALWTSARGLLKRLMVAKGDPLTTPYWGNLPFKLGSQVTKYLLRPEVCDGQSGLNQVQVSRSSDFLSEALAEHIQKQAVCYGFYLQAKGTDEESPVEDATVAWREDDPFLTRVGQVQFPVQEPNELLTSLNLPAAGNQNGKRICQHLSFSPWNTTADYKPLSSLNRARRVIYELSTAMRREINRATNPVEQGP